MLELENGDSTFQFICNNCSIYGQPEGNFSADCLSKVGSSSSGALQMFDEAPTGMLHLLVADASGNQFLRA
ncbi:hypothetical protein E2542_SST09834 [Spatholobus suberectus]|nr:hypothetical protein E2542_SST09834 [Spatholobus suberectus]